MAQKQRKDPAFASVLYHLIEGDAAYDRGGRYKLVDRSEGEFVFKTKDQAINFINIHSFYLVSADNMNQIREEYNQNGDQQQK